MLVLIRITTENPTQRQKVEVIVALSCVDMMDQVILVISTLNALEEFLHTHLSAGGSGSAQRTNAFVLESVVVNDFV